MTTPFTMTPNAVLFDTALPPLARLLWAALEHHSGEHRTCWSGYVALAKEVGCSPRWIPILIKRLVEAGLLIVQHRPGKTNIYTLLGRVARQKAVPAPSSPPPRKPDKDEQKQPTKTKEDRAHRPFKEGVDFSKWLPGGVNEKFTRPLGA